ncbi:MutY, A/G-specific DNA glycosylase [Propionibacterium freudenreichii]|uniref:A/G-specific adenine glycosylase n=1 Tax=Propionibacterium freudenreichii TaxID=1744 RepID=UPI0005A5CE04|nr:MutY, A/G-specific DNA glycosylase [Propionibacterium freudenreichii]
MMEPGQRRAVVRTVNQWYAHAARDLPWRRVGTSPWAIMVSEFMAQQTPVARVVGPWREWLDRWPTPDALAAEPSSAAVAAWGRLGYPRRALRLHAAATAIRDHFGGEVPHSVEELRQLPGVGDYTAGAIASFAFGARALVLDTNVRRVLTRLDAARQFPANSTTAAERRLAMDWLPDDAPTAARWAQASMELGALVCTATNPACDDCPVRADCAWLAAGRPAHDGSPRRTQAYAGTDRQARGTLLGALRTTPEGFEVSVLLQHWPADPAQAGRALDGLLSDGLAHREGTRVTL